MPGYALLDRPNPNGSHFYRTRRGPGVKGCVQHITASLQDLGMTGVDASAEGEVRYAQTTGRAVSWHDGVDSDGVIRLLPGHMTAFHCRGYNSTTIGQEISKRSTDWRTAPDAWVEAVLRNSAAAWRPHVIKYGIPLRHATRGELDRAIANDSSPVGFLSHGQLDPSRRTDPGLVGSSRTDTFPWRDLFALIRGGVTDDDDVPNYLPRFPLPDGHYFGTERPEPECHSGALAKDRDEVETLQRGLLRRGWKVAADGVYGAQTEDVVKTFQREHGLDVDGLVGVATWRRIDKAPIQ